MKAEQMVEVFKRCGIKAVEIDFYGANVVNVQQKDGSWLHMHPAQWQPEDLKRHLVARGAKPVA